MIPYGIIWLWTWVPAAVAVLAFFAALTIGLSGGSWLTSGRFVLIGGAAAAIFAGSYFSFWQDRNSK
ncbi:MAG: hypothetical protein ACREMY_11980 [bacterium]